MGSLFGGRAHLNDIQPFALHEIKMVAQEGGSPGSKDEQVIA